MERAYSIAGAANHEITCGQIAANRTKCPRWKVPIHFSLDGSEYHERARVRAAFRPGLGGRLGSRQWQTRRTRTVEDDPCIEILRTDGLRFALLERSQRRYSGHGFPVEVTTAPCIYRGVRLMGLPGVSAARTKALRARNLRCGRSIPIVRSLVGTRPLPAVLIPQ